MERRNTSEKRIREIFKREPEKWLRCKDVIQKAKKDGVSATTVYRNLRRMVEKNILEKDRKAWKNSRYRLNPQKIPERDAHLLSFKRATLNDIVLDIINKTRGNFTEVEILKQVFDWISVLSIYTILKELETGHPYTEAVTHLIRSPDFTGLRTLIRRAIIITEKPLADVDIEMRAKLFRIEEPLPEEYKAGIDRFKSALKRIAETRFKAIEKIDIDIEEGRRKVFYEPPEPVTFVAELVEGDEGSK